MGVSLCVQACGRVHALVYTTFLTDIPNQVIVCEFL